MYPKRRQIVPAYLVWAALAGYASGAVPVIYSPSIGLAPTAADQQIQLFISGTDLVAGENFNLQFDSGTSGPIFKNVDILTATIFAASNTGQIDSNTGQPGSGIVGGTSAFAGHVVTLAVTTVDGTTVLDNGLQVTLTVNTNGQTSGTFQLNLLGTSNDNTTLIRPDSTEILPSFPQNTFAIGGNTWAVNHGDTWNLNANWTAAAPNGGGAWANFLEIVPGGSATVTLDGDRTVGVLFFSNSSASYTIAQGIGGTLFMNNGSAAPVITSNSGTHFITAPVTFAQSMNVIVAKNSVLTLAGALSGVGLDLNTSGVGTLVLSGVNAYAGTSIAPGAVLQMGTGGTTGNLGTAAVIDGGTLLVRRSDSLTISNVISGGGDLTFTGGTLAITAASNSFSGVTSVLAGVINVASANGLANSTVNYQTAGGSVNFATPTVNIGGLAGDRVWNIGPGNVLNAGANGSSTVFTGGFSGSGDFHKTGGGMLQLSATANGFGGNIFLEAGTLALNTGSALGTGAGSLVLNAGALRFGNGSAPFVTSERLFLNSNITMTRLGGAATDAMSGNWTGTNRVTTFSLPTGESLWLNGTGGQFTAYNGTVALGSSAGTLRLGGLNGSTPIDVAMGGVLLDLGTGAVASGSGGIQTIGTLKSSSSTSALSGLLGVSTASTSTPVTNYVVGGAGVSSTFAGTIADGIGAGALTALTKNGTATLTLSDSSKTYSGGTTINDGMLFARGTAGSTLTLLGTGPVTLATASSALRFTVSNSVHTVGNIGGTTNNATVGSVLVNTSVGVTSGYVRAGSLTLIGSLALAAGSPVSKVQTLTIAHTGSGTGATYTGLLQLNNNKLVVQTADAPSKATAITSLNEALFFGRGTGSSWTGTKGITSSAAAANAAQLTVGVFDNAALKDPLNSSNPRTSWGGGVNNVDTNSLLVTTALKGDVNLDGIVNFVDFAIMATNFGSTGTLNGISTLATSSGDANADGVVNFVDFAIAATNFGQTTSTFNLVSAVDSLGLGEQLADAEAGGFSLSPAQVPEPATLLMLAIPFACFAFRPRRARRVG